MSTVAWTVESLHSLPLRRPGFGPNILPIVAADAIAILAAGTLSVLARYYLGGAFELSMYLRLSGLVVVYLLSFALNGLYPPVVLHPVAEFQSICRANTLSVLLLGTATFFQRDAEAYSRAILLVVWILSIVFVTVARVVARYYLGRTSWWGEPVVVLGGGATGQALVKRLAERPSIGLRVVALLDDDPQALRNFGDLPPACGGFDLAPEIADRFDVRYAIVAMPGVPSHRLSALVEQYASRYHHVLIIPDLFGISSLGVDARDLGGLLGVAVSHRLLFRSARAIKRVFDLVFAGLGLLCGLPLFALLALLVRLSSQGPVFYGHRRLGVGGQPFVAWKFRTMVRDSDQALARFLLQNPGLGEEWTRDRKLRNDPRITWIGRILRHTSLDELPQLWNVLRGQMSLVGPRPIVEAEIEKYGRQYALYRKVRPGITGLWQVSGRNNTTYEERVACDEYYVRNWSVFFDLYIIGHTVKVVLTGDGAY